MLGAFNSSVVGGVLAIARLRHYVPRRVRKGCEGSVSKELAPVNTGKEYVGSSSRNHLLSMNREYSWMRESLLPP